MTQCLLYLWVYEPILRNAANHCFMTRAQWLLISQVANLLDLLAPTPVFLISRLKKGKGFRITKNCKSHLLFLLLYKLSIISLLCVDEEDERVDV